MSSSRLEIRAAELRETLHRALIAYHVDDDSIMSDAAYVGDSPFDIRAAKAAGTFAIAVAWGGIHAEERLAEEEPDALVRTTEELHAAL